MNEPILPQIVPILNPSIKNIAGQRFGRLLVLGYLGTESRKAIWLCQCDCGSTVSAVGKYLRSGEKRSCGCLHRDTIGDKMRSHGMSRTKLFARWQAMRKRCYYENGNQYRDYGGRGIKVCDRWQSFQNFYADMGDPPSDKHSIDRIDNNGDYCPENCRWATRSEQNNNTRYNRVIEHDGKSMTVAQWSEHLGLNKGVISGRLDRYGWSVEKALTTPVSKK